MSGNNSSPALQTEYEFGKPIMGDAAPSIFNRTSIIFKVGRIARRFIPPRECKIVNMPKLDLVDGATAIIEDDSEHNMPFKVVGFRSALCNECSTQIKAGCPFFNNPGFGAQPKI